MSKYHHPSPRLGEIVRCFMPDRESLFKRGPKPRPVLVAGCSDDLGYPELLVVYGTSQRLGYCEPGEFVVSYGTRQKPYETKFCLNRQIWLPLNEEFFGGNLVVLGKLTRRDGDRFHCALEAFERAEARRQDPFWRDQ